MARVSEGLLVTGQVREAEELAKRALNGISATTRGYHAHVARILGALALHRDPADMVQAQDYYQQALAMARELKMRPLEAHCHLGLGHVYMQTNRVEQARAEVSAAIQLYRDMEMTSWLPQAEAALAKVGRQA